MALLDSTKLDPSLDPEDLPPSDLPETIIPLSHVQEERKLRQEVTAAFHSVGQDQGDEQEEAEEEEDGFLTKSAPKSKSEISAEAQAYRKFLLENSTNGSLSAFKDLLGTNENEESKERIEIGGQSSVKGGAGHSGQVDAAASGQVDELVGKADKQEEKEKTGKKKGKERRKQKDDEFLMK